MQVTQSQWTPVSGWAGEYPGPLALSAQLVLVFGGTEALATKVSIAEIKAAYPNACVLGCSTAGEIAGTHVRDDSVVVTAARFEHTWLAATEIDLAHCTDSREAGAQLARLLDPRGLVHALVISDGLKINGSELVKGLSANLPPGVAVTGGLSADGTRFAQTLVCSGDDVRERKIAIVGFYGDRLRVGYGSMGGWDAFGPDRIVTRSHANVLYELDGQSALKLYKSYLGEHAERLPSSGLLFPLAIRGQATDTAVVRTILAVDEKAQSMTFAGDVPEGSSARLMRANFERLIEGASVAARVSQEAASRFAPQLAILISCVGRKLVLKQRVEDEVEAVRDILGPQAVMTGFYSYGEISPFSASARCELHNQTMTVTTFAEV